MMKRTAARACSLHVGLWAALLPAVLCNVQGHSALSRISVTEREWNLDIAGYDLPVVPELGVPYEPPAGVCNGLAESAIAIQGSYMGMLSPGPNMGDKLVADVYVEVLAESLYRLLNATVAIKYQYTEQKEPLSNSTCHDLMPGQPCVFSIAGGGSMIYTLNMAVWHMDLSWYVFGTGVEGNKPDGPKSTLRIAISPTHTMGGVRGPITERLFHMFRRHLPVLGDAGLLAGFYFVDGYRDKLEKDTPYGRNLEDVLVHNGSRLGPVPEGRPLMIVSWKNNISSNTWETWDLDVNSPFVQLYIKLVNQWAKKYQVIFQPCENAASMWHFAFQKHVNKQLPEGAVPVLVHNNFRNYSQILRLCAAADVAISGRLHSGVMCNSVGTPTVFLSNNLKFVDYLSSMGLPHMRLNVPTENSFAIDSFAQRVNDMVAHALKDRSQISAVLRASQRESHKLHVRAMSSWWRSAESKMAPRLARLSCCKHGVIIEQGTVYISRMMNIKIGCRQLEEGSVTP